jgi:hypothetical protein
MLIFFLVGWVQIELILVVPYPRRKFLFAEMEALHMVRQRFLLSES